MKKTLLIVLSALILASCGNDKPVENIVSKNDVDLTGNAFQSFRLGGDVRLLMAPNTDDNSKWMIRATVPLQKADDRQIGAMTADINLLDGNGTKVREGFMLSAEDLASLIPVFNAANEKAVALFLERKIGYLQIPELIRGAMESHTPVPVPSVEEILEAERCAVDYCMVRSNC